MQALNLPAWRKSRYSVNEAQCVEVAELAGGRAVRDSKDPGGPALRFGAAQWGAAIAAISRGEIG